MAAEVALRTRHWDAGPCLRLPEEARYPRALRKARTGRIIRTSLGTGQPQAFGVARMTTSTVTEVSPFKWWEIGHPASAFWTEVA
jgi:hypothetical protein